MANPPPGSGPPPGGRPPSASEAVPGDAPAPGPRRPPNFRRTLIKVMTVQVITLLLLWLAQARFHVDLG